MITQPVRAVLVCTIDVFIACRGSMLKASLWMWTGNQHALDAIPVHDQNTDNCLLCLNFVPDCLALSGAARLLNVETHHSFASFLCHTLISLLS